MCSVQKIWDIIERQNDPNAVVSKTVIRKKRLEYQSEGKTKNCFEDVADIKMD